MTLETSPASTSGIARPLLHDLPECLEGARVVLRPYRPGDGGALHEAVEESHAELAPWMPWLSTSRQPQGCEEFVRRSAAQWLLRDALNMGIWERSTGRFLGSTGYPRMDWSVPRYEIGYWLRTSATGQGYMSEAVTLLRDAAFGPLRAERVIITCDSRNLASVAVARRAGFHCEGTLHAATRGVDGTLRDTLLFALTRAQHERLVR